MKAGMLLPLALVMLVGGLPSGAQTPEDSYVPTPVSVSKDKVRRGRHVFYAHVVLERQTLYSIARAYRVSRQDIIDVNRQIETQGLRAGDIILIPVNPDPEAQPLEESADTLSPEPMMQEPMMQEPADSLESASFTVETVFPDTIALTLLIPSEEDCYLNFHNGALLGAQSLGEEGIHLRINAVDVSDSLEFSNLRSAVSGSHVIIGPFSHEDVSQAATCLEPGQYLVSPLDPRTEDLADTGKVILAATPASVQVRDAAVWCRENADTIIVVSETDGRITPVQQEMKAQFDTAAEPNVIAVSYAFAEGYQMADWFAAHTHLPDTAEARLFVASDRDLFVTDIIRNAGVQAGFGKMVSVYGPAKARQGEMEDLCDAGVHASTSFHIDWSDPEVIGFVRAYRALFHRDPDSYSFHGYDVIRYFVHACALYGTAWPESICEYRDFGLQTDFSFVSTGMGYVNNATRRVEYTPGYKAVIVR